MCLNAILSEAQKLPDQNLREILAMAKGMDAANKINQEQSA